MQSARPKKHWRVAERGGPSVYTIAAHRGFADALVAGLVPRYSDPLSGLAHLTVLLPSGRAVRNVTAAFIRHYGESGANGMLMPRMAVIGDLELDEALGPLLDIAEIGNIPPAVDPTERWLRIAGILREELQEPLGKDCLPDAAILRMARDMAATIDRLLVEDIGPEELLGDAVIDVVADVQEHWRKTLHRFARVQARWQSWLEDNDRVDAASRRNALFRATAHRWRENPPQQPIVAAGITSAAPALAKLLRMVANLPQGAVVLPDLDLHMSDAAWEELGLAGQSPDPQAAPFSRREACAHPQYHLKLLLNRMGMAREEVRPWHRKGMGAAPSARSQAISNLFLPPNASRSWVDLEPVQRQLSGVKLMESANPGEEAQAVALLVRQALEVPGKRISVITPDRSLARRVAHNLSRWGIAADDSGGLPLSQSPAGRLLLLLAKSASSECAPVSLIALLGHPLVAAHEDRGHWLSQLRAFELELRGPRPAPGLAPLAEVASAARVLDWWRDRVEPLLARLIGIADRGSVADAIDTLASVGEAMCGESLWAREDGRALSAFVEGLREKSSLVGTTIDRADLAVMLDDAMAEIAIRPPYGGHPRVAILGLLESRMSRSDLVICAGLTEGTWPGIPAPDPLLAPRVLRAMGIPANEFRIGLAAHDLASAMGAPEVVLSYSLRDMSGPAIPSRFLSRVKALMGSAIQRQSLAQVVDMAGRLDAPTQPVDPYPRPAPQPPLEQRPLSLKVTALDRLLGDPYQFYAAEILRLRSLDGLDARPTPAWQGTIAHKILEIWHSQRKSDPKAQWKDIAEQVFEQGNIHPVMRGLWQPRLFAALEWVADRIDSQTDREVAGVEVDGKAKIDGVSLYGRADRIDRNADGSLVIIDYKTGEPPSAAKVKRGFALQLGLLGLIAEHGEFDQLPGMATEFEYWSLAKKKGAAAFGYVDVPMKVGRKTKGLEPKDFLPKTLSHFRDGVRRYLKGDAAFTAKLNPDYPGYDTYDQLMRLDEWQIDQSDSNSDTEPSA